MKKASLLILAFITLLGLHSCDEEDSLEFVAQPSSEGVTFGNSFSAEYLLSEETGSNIAERFFWNQADFDAPVNITYDLEASIDPEFSDFDLVGTTTETNQAVTVDRLLGYAEDLGLDDDPESVDMNTGLPNNTGEVYFRLHAYTGSGEANTVDVYSDIQPLTIRWIEKVATDAGCPSLWVVGAAAVDAGWNWDSPIEFLCNSEVYTARVNLTNDTFRFFETQGDWDSGLNYTYFEEDGYTIDPLFENAADGDTNFRFIGTPGIYEVVVDDNAKTITLTASTPYYLIGDGVPSGWNWDNPVEAVETSPYIRTATLNFNSTGAFRFFTVRDDWNTGLNYPYFEDAGYTIDPLFENAEDGDSNFSFVGTSGTFTITINDLEKTITLE